jgi:hypothetical protein
VNGGSSTINPITPLLSTVLYMLQNRMLFN